MAWRRRAEDAVAGAADVAAGVAAARAERANSSDWDRRPMRLRRKKGDPLYKQNCSTCHGDNARGSQGPDLTRSVVVLHDEKDEEIGPVIKSGSSFRAACPHSRSSPPTTSTTFHSS
jgi:mono/diheme cytochrome c family protein